MRFYRCKQERSNIDICQNQLEPDECEKCTVRDYCNAAMQNILLPEVKKGIVTRFSVIICLAANY